MVYQWNPGHMTKARRAMQEDIKLIDLIIELVDAREKGNSARCGFIHVPYLPDQAAAAVSNAPSMSLELMVQALTIAVGTIVECR